MPADHTKVAYASVYGAYANVGVYDVNIQVGPDTITPGEVKGYGTEVELDEPGHYATCLVQTNDYTGAGPFTPTALRWTPYPPAYIIYIALTTDPYSAGVIDAAFGLVVKGNTVEFWVNITNPYDMDIAIAETIIGVQYSVYNVRD